MTRIEQPVTAQENIVNVTLNNLVQKHITKDLDEAYRVIEIIKNTEDYSEYPYSDLLAIGRLAYEKILVGKATNQTAFVHCSKDNMWKLRGSCNCRIKRREI